MSEKSASSSISKQLQMPSHEMSLSSSSSIRTSLQAMFDFNFDEASKDNGNHKKPGGQPLVSQQKGRPKI